MSKALFLDLYELTMAQVYFKYKRNTCASFDLFIRSDKRPFYVACGIEEALRYVEELRFTKEDIDYLRELALFEDEFLEYLKEFKFKGQIWAVEEPEIVFAQEPIMRVSANIIEAQIIESVLLNKINLATTLATKATRVVLAAGTRAVYDFSLRRTQGLEASMAAAKYSYVAGAKGTSNVNAGFLYKIPVAGTMAHSFVMSFRKEVESFTAFCESFPAKSILLVDTYDVKEGIKSAIRAAKFLKKEGVGLLGIRLDSGNLLEDSKLARSLLDRQGLIDSIIVASGNLDEYKIQELTNNKAPIDAFGVGSNMGCSSDFPYTDVIYKLTEIKEKDSDFIPVMKLSQGKSTLPSKKQIFRSFGRNSTMQSDTIGIFDEKISGSKLMRKVMDGGVSLSKEKSVEEKRELLAQKIKKLPKELLNIKSKYMYPVEISNKLTSLYADIARQIKDRISQKVVFVDINTKSNFFDKKDALGIKNSGNTAGNLRRLVSYAFKNKIKIVPFCVDSGMESKIDTSLKNFANLLENIFAEKVYIYGIVNKYSIKETINALVKRGFLPCVVKDALRGVSLQEKKELALFCKNKKVELTTTSELLRQIS